ncbi:unnamed protein product [Oreochromis niloticus]|nr:unnamed protein product [Mustela putorius furo]
MKLDVCCCLLAAAALGSNVAADFIHKIPEEKQLIALHCPHSVEGEVRWSRESGGSRADILTADGDGDTKHISDPQKRYDSQADGSLIILRAALSDSGRYFCNHEAAVELTVIHQELQPETEERAQRSPDENTLTLTDVQLGDSGLYSCAEGAAVYLNETKDPTDTSQKADVNESVFIQPLISGAHFEQRLVLGAVAPLIFITVILLFITWRCRNKRKERSESAEPKVDPVGRDPSGRGGSHQGDVTYSLHPPALRNKPGKASEIFEDIMKYSRVSPAAPRANTCVYSVIKLHRQEA